MDINLKTRPVILAASPRRRCLSVYRASRVRNLTKYDLVRAFHFWGEERTNPGNFLDLRNRGCCCRSDRRLGVDHRENLVVQNIFGIGFNCIVLIHYVVVLVVIVDVAVGVVVIKRYDSVKRVENDLRCIE